MGAREGHRPPKILLLPPSGPPKIRSLSVGLFLKVLHRPLTAPLVAKLAPLSLKFKTGAEVMAIWEVAPGPSSILTVLPNRLTYALYSTLNAIVMGYDTRLQQWICEPLMFLWFNNR